MLTDSTESTSSPGLVAEQILAEVLGSGPSGVVSEVAADGSIHDVLAPRLHRWLHGDRAALAPSPVINRALGRVVALSTTATDDRAASTAERHLFLSDVVDQVCHRIDVDTDLTARARTVRRSAGAAETEMEIHYAGLFMEQAEPGLLRPGSAAGADALVALRRLFAPFPYFRNYELLVAAEQKGLDRPADRVVFCGGGALPLTGLLWHLTTGADVTLIEIDTEVAAIATRIVERLAELQLIDGDAVRVVAADATTIDHREADLVIIASLLDNEAVLRLVSRLAADSADGSTRGAAVLIRSARGLVARFAYDEIDVDAICRQGLTHQGMVAPASIVGVGLDHRAGSSRNIFASDDPKLLAVADVEVLNTSEVFLAAGGPARPAQSGGNVARSERL